MDQVCVQPPTGTWKAAGRTLAELGRTPDGPRLRFGDPAAAQVSPAPVRGACPQDRLDSVLLPVVSLASDTDGVTAVLADGSRVRGGYAVVADGASSAVRDGLGVSTLGRGRLGVPKMNIVFRADLYSRFGAVPYMTDITAPGAWAMLITVDGHDLWMLHVDYDPAKGESAEDFTDARCAALVRQAVGVPELPVEIVSRASWWLHSQLAERFAHGRAFLAGDAAHAIPPLGAFGMNLGIADAHNLAWKVALVLRGTADGALLDSYDTERRPVAAFTLQQAMLRLRNPALHWNPMAGDARRAVGAVSTPNVELGYRYDSPAVVGPEPVPPSTEDVRLNLDGAPGSRVPHLWVEHDGRRLSTLDLVASRFTVLAGPDGTGWCAAAERYAADTGSPLGAHRVGGSGPVRDPENRWPTPAGVDPTGALLVRPDGFVAWRATDGSGGGDPYRQLDRVLRAVLGHDRDHGNEPGAGAGVMAEPAVGPDVSKVAASLPTAP